MFETGQTLPVTSDDPRLLNWYHTIELSDGLVSQGVYDHRPVVDRYGLMDPEYLPTLVDSEDKLSPELHRRLGTLFATRLIRVSPASQRRCVYSASPSGGTRENEPHWW